MATRKTVEEVEEFVASPLTVISEAKKPKYTGPMVTVFIPPLIEESGNGVKVDQYEHVTIANEHGEECWKVLRGENVEVPVPVFVQLKQRYNKI